MAKFRGMGFWNWVRLVISNKWQGVVNRLIAPALLAILRAPKGSWRERRVKLFCYTLWKIPANWLLNSRISNQQVEAIYDQASGSYIKQQNLKGYQHWAMVDGRPTWVSSVEVASLLREEMCQGLGPADFDSILEVGVGELNTLAFVADHFGPGKRYLGIELSLNRLCHGYDFFCRGQGLKASLAKADACHLPLPDKSVDVIYTAHCLELMPRDNYQKAIQEMCRVARRRVCLFEPSWELSGTLPRLKMRADQYVRGIPEFVRGLAGVRLARHQLLATTPNPFNRTALHRIEVEAPAASAPAAPDWVCPVCHGGLRDLGCYQLCAPCARIYFVYEGIPLLDPAYGPKVTCLLGPGKPQADA